MNTESNKAVPPLDAVARLATHIQALQRQMAQSCAAEVEQLIAANSRNQNRIENLLDRLLDCACLSEGLAQFKKLCRYYYLINPEATTFYVNAYRELWDSEAQQGEQP